jgi:DNA-binding NarL/FixJ family response regulator
MIKIIIVDDHELFRLGVRTAIELRHPNIVITGESGSGGVFRLRDKGSLRSR